MKYDTWTPVPMFCANCGHLNYGYLDVLSSLMNKRNKLIQSGKYTDGIDEVIMKIKTAKKRTFRVLYI